MSSVTALAEGPPRLQAGGTLNPRRHLYLERPQDQEFLELLLDGQYVNLLTSRQMGKSSLMVRAAQVLASQGVRPASIDLAAELGTPADAGSYFLGLLIGIARGLGVNIGLEAWWRERGSETVNQRLMRFFRDVVAEQIEDPVVIFLDEIDSTLKLPYTDDLFTAIRGMHNERATVPAYERTTFCLIGVATPNELIKDRRTTPYNVGRVVELRDFDPRRDDLAALEQALSPDPELGRAMLARVLYWTAGHPYLTLRLCSSLQDIDAATPNDVDRQVEDSFRSLERVSESHFQQVLRFLETRLTEGLATFNLYQRVLDGKRERDQPAPAHTELKLSGLVKRDEEGCLVVRNRIYERLFDRRWIESTRPRRTLKTYKRYAIAAGVALLISGGWIASLQMDRESLQMDRESLQKQLNERQQLEALGISITSPAKREGTRVVFPVDTDQVLLEEVARLLKAVGPVTELSLRTTPVMEPKSRVTNVAPLMSFTSLRSLDLAGTRVSDTAPLANLTNLELLTLSGTPVGDLTSVTKLTMIQQLDLDATAVTDLDGLATLTNLQRLNLSNTQVAEIRSLANLKSLKELDLTGTRVVDLASLARLTNLARLNLVRTRVSDLAPIRELTGLEWIDIAGTQVTDLGDLMNLDKLKYLGIGGGSFSVDRVSDYLFGDLSTGSLANDFNRVPRAERGNAAPIVSFSDLSDLTELKWLDLYETNISDLRAIEKLQHIIGLSLGKTSVVDVSPLSGLKTLIILNLRETKISDIAPLASLASLQYLDVEGTEVKDAVPLANLTDLEWLDLENSKVADLTPLTNLTNLQWLDLSGTKVADLAPLANLTNLQRLDLRGAEVSQESVAHLKQALAERGSRSVEILGP